ncbi:Glyoxylate reductase [Wickerhamomyces ciferrii]|uniref:Glyoxylate reductase n=1 Tax=Wickerhamomyces ciferrii (strain ATCC 14091 / BCRC 22168 / CBS 111 / JCM 3599 / NBRC 0793 / NRRL Y-1031 F-60-10) TaxID=1206466 RepID=K0KNV9_WICCF|nr:Glyoxylate reductase [Wickerhamomyces ciferrii]CCH43089.1 Glyoxylate reductase [Wickerhamomyces ciferrii]
MSTKPIVLRLGTVRYAQEAWKELEKVATVIVSESKNREEFIKDLQTKYSQVQHITRTFDSANETGLFDKELIQHLPKSLISISHNGAGYDQISAPELIERKIQLSNVPEIVDNATADNHVFLLLGALRNFGHGRQNLLAGEWPSKGNASGAPIGHDPQGKVVGIVGLGGIGRTILKRLQPFGFEKFIYHNRNRLPEDLEGGAEYVSLDELLSTSDIISINIPLSPKTKHFFNEEKFSKMKKGVVIVNTARGGVIDETAFIKYLTNGTVRSAGLDVLENEPNVNKELISLPNVLALPHMGTHTVETVKAMEEHVVKNVENVIKTGKVISLVPEHKNIDFTK